ncbi:MAG: DUF3365 domain-containing protein [Deltaproteobacteria bacterium]|nr:DUF3365 domain-containing protein [Deltaproteobacteria bacterium]MBW2070626.1 DUF3365 domain-containing protein [Deltaproteobacteria bacterium]
MSIALIIFPILGIIFLWISVQHEQQSLDQIRTQARALARQIVLTRQWISDCGGVMVLRRSRGAQNTVCYYDDRLETSRGTYQRFTPAMVTKKLSQYSQRQDMYQFHLASLNPLNPDNRPDDFEKRALEMFQREGLTEVSAFKGQGQEQRFFYMVPLRMDDTCLECHQQQGFTRGAVGGGLSVILPIGKMRAAVGRDQLKLAVAGVGLSILTIFTLFVLLRRMVIRPLQELEGVTAEISAGNLAARVNISTGDEFEKLGQAFNSMARSLADSRESLEEKIRQATRELSEANSELQSLDKLKSDFLANMSHELRSPLTVIRGGVDYLNRTIQGVENRRYLAVIDKNLARLIHLVSDLFDFTRIEADKADWCFEKENVSSLVQEVVEIIGPLAKEKDIAITYKYPTAIYAYIDLERIEQVLVNLIENAIKFSEQGTTINIVVKEHEDEVQLAVSDQGVGISEENLEVIFEKFHTLPSSGSRGRHEGTGLGLAICKGIIEAHGGEIWAKSVAGEGSVFYFTLPTKKQND